MAQGFRSFSPRPASSVVSGPGVMQKHRGGRAAWRKSAHPRVPRKQRGTERSHQQMNPLLRSEPSPPNHLSDQEVSGTTRWGPSPQHMNLLEGHFISEPYHFFSAFRSCPPCAPVAHPLSQHAPQGTSQPVYLPAPALAQLEKVRSCVSLIWLWVGVGCKQQKPAKAT